jgi:hypothetical protein
MPVQTRSSAARPVRQIVSMAWTLVMVVACATTAPSASAPGPAASAALPSSQGSAAAGSPAPVRVDKSLPPYAPVIDPADFVAEVTNPYFPLKPGTTYIVEGTRDGVARREELTVTHETKTIMGVPCIVIRDVATSQTALVEKTTDWYAQDKDGNVWYFGEDTAEYTDGKVSSTAGTWLAGVDGALPGIIMKAGPTVADEYRQEFRPGIAEDYATVLETDASRSTPAGAFEKVVVTEDVDLLDRTKNEHKSYAPGIGLVGSDGMVSGHHEVRALISILTSN